MSDLRSRPDHWTDALPQSWQQAINTSPILNALGRALNRRPADIEGASKRIFAQPGDREMDDRAWLLQQAQPQRRLNPLAAEMLDKGGTLAMFLGPGAKMADMKTLARAQTRTASGVPREQVWKEDGWFQGPDGKWRFEIDDSGAAWRLPTPEGMVPGRSITQTARNALNHPELYSSYAGIGDIPLQYVHIANPQGPLPFGKYKTGPEAIAIRAVPEFADPRSTTLHELQHAVQIRENFARGGSSAMGGDDRYRRLAGEVEARAVQNRRNLTGPERRERPPWLDYDVPENRQIVLD